MPRHQILLKSVPTFLNSQNVKIYPQYLLTRSITLSVQGIRKEFSNMYRPLHHPQFVIIYEDNLKKYLFKTRILPSKKEYIL